MKGVRRREERNAECLENYDILEEIGQGGTCRVFLVRHKILGALRAVKCICASHPGYKTVLQEGRVLQNLNHPGIPRIYDMVEDAHTFYLIEEYVSGESLQTLRSVQLNFSQEQIIEYGIEICSIIQYLHEQRPFPLIYLDLKPEHIFVTANGIKIIDFGSVTEERQYDSRAGILGTKGFCAPELLKGGSPGVRTDIYAVGAVLYYLMYGQVYSGKENKSFLGKGKNSRLGKVIEKCLKPETERYSNICLLRRELEGLRTYYGQSEPHSLKIAVAGAKEHSGTTHFSIGLTSYLNRIGKKAVYQDKSGKNTVDTIFEHCNGMEESGCVRYGNFCGIPDYGPGVFVEKDFYGYHILDFGRDISDRTAEVLDCDMVFYLLGSSLWEPVCFGELKDGLRKAYPVPLRLVAQYGLTEENRRQLKKLGIKNCLIMPFFQDIWEPGRKTSEFYASALKCKA